MEKEKGTHMRAVDYFKDNGTEIDLVKSICKKKGLKKSKFIENAIHHEIERYYNLLDEEQKERFSKYIE